MDAYPDAYREPVRIDAGPADATPSVGASGERALMRAVLLVALGEAPAAAS